MSINELIKPVTKEEAESMVSQNAIPSKWFAFSKMDIGAVEILGRLV